VNVSKIDFNAKLKQIVCSKLVNHKTSSKNTPSALKILKNANIT